jgi:hypothetical protein
MKKLIWTKADAGRAANMGWCLAPIIDKHTFQVGSYRIACCIEIWRVDVCLQKSPFKSDDDAIKFVFEVADSCYGGPACPKVKTCRKAVLLCMGAKRGEV